jgi:hypothetical protein
VSFSVLRLTPLFVALVTGFAALPARAQFTAAGGLIAPVGFHRPLVGYGGLGFNGLGLMQNPYEGYLNGAANLTTANAQYQLTIQQARLEREKSRRSALQTRRDTLAERQYELSLMPDPEKIRQDELARALQRSRNNPPQTEIWSGKALNDLLRGIQTTQSKGSLGQDVPLPPDVLKHINLTGGVITGGTGLLKDGGKLTWPYVLRQSMFASDRKPLDEQMRKAVKEAQSGEVSVEVLNDLGASLKQLEGAVDARVADLTPSQYIQAMRYVRELKESYKVLQQSDVAKYFRPAWTAQGTTVAELVRQMTQQGLRFGPAVSGDETYYTVLHRALVDYDGGSTQLTATAPRR